MNRRESIKGIFAGLAAFLIPSFILNAAKNEEKHIDQKEKEVLEYWAKGWVLVNGYYEGTHEYSMELTDPRTQEKTIKHCKIPIKIKATKENKLAFIKYHVNNQKYEY